MKKLGIVTALVLVLLFLTNFWVSSPLSGQVRDSKGQPVRNAVVAVAWAFDGWHAVHPFLMSESVTDANGAYHIPGWARFSPIFLGHMTNGPDVFVVHRAYAPLYLRPRAQDHRSYWNASPKARSVLVLQPLSDDTLEQAAQDMRGIMGQLCLLHSSPQSLAIFARAGRFIEEANALEKRLPPSQLNLASCSIHVSNEQK